MKDYETLFQARGHLYNRASEICPGARLKERRLLLDRLPLKPGQVVCDAPAGGGFLTRGLAERGVRVICVEPSSRFAEAIGQEFETLINPLTALELTDQSVDHMASLAGLHHVDEPQSFFDEAWRVIRPGGSIAVADVKSETPVARFLNGPVDDLSETGHQGRFFTENDMLAHLTAAGFDNCEIEFVEFCWEFPDMPTLLSYCWHLFGLTKSSPDKLEPILGDSLGYSSLPSGVGLKWSLLYGRASKTA